VEAVVNEGLLVFSPNRLYKQSEVGRQISDRECLDMSDEDQAIFSQAFRQGEDMKLTGKTLALRGKTLIDLFNSRIRLKKKRWRNKDTTFIFRVKAVEEKLMDDKMQRHIPAIRAVYKQEAKTAADWYHLAFTRLQRKRHVETERVVADVARGVQVLHKQCRNGV
jgi:hypothetical protein